MRINSSRVLLIRREQDELGFSTPISEEGVTSSGDSVRIDDCLKNSDSAEKRATIFAKQRQNENGVAPRSYQITYL